DHAAAHARVANLLINALQLVFHGAKAKVFDAAMGEHQDVACLLQGGFEVLQIEDFQINVCQPVVRDAIGFAGSAEAEPGGADRDVDRLIFPRESPIAAASPASHA